MAEIFHIDYLDIQARIHCTHGHFSQLQMVTSVNYGQLASDAITSTPVNLDGWNFSCRLLRHTGMHTLHSWSPGFNYRWSPRFNYGQLASDAITSTPVNLDGWNFSYRLLRHTGTHTLHSWSPRFNYRWSVNYGQLASDAITSRPVNLDGWNFSFRLLHKNKIKYSKFRFAGYA